MNKLDNARRVQVIRCLVEGNSIRSTVRITGVAKNTVVKLLVDIGGACAFHHDKLTHYLSFEPVDEILTSVYNILNLCGTTHSQRFTVVEAPSL